MLRDRPVFIVGMPRSGTKLIRDLLNTHSRVSIPEQESDLIPYLVQKYGDPPDFSSGRQVDELLADIRNSNFYSNSRRKGYDFNEAEMRSVIATAEWSKIIRFLLISMTPDPGNAAIVWGDKTPGYVTKMPLLSRIFPEARFLHIVRDPRDYACSVEKAWGKSPVLAARTWDRTIRQVDEFLAVSDVSYLEIRYEKLTAEPNDTLKDVLDFLELEDEPGFGTLTKPVENLGDARGSTQVLADNTGKYLEYFSGSKLALIEGICFETMVSRGYTPELVNKPARLARSQWIYLRLMDVVASTSFHVRTKGLWAGSRYAFLGHFKSSWRDLP